MEREQLTFFASGWGTRRRSHLGSVEAAIKLFAPFYGPHKISRGWVSEGFALGTLRSSGRRKNDAGHSNWNVPACVPPAVTDCTANWPTTPCDCNSLRSHFHGLRNPISCAITNRGLCHHMGIPRGRDRQHHDQVPCRHSHQRILDLAQRFLQLQYVYTGSGWAMSLTLHSPVAIY
jgi:hypothetical protein